MKKVITTPAAPLAVGPYSQAIKTTGLLFLSGQIPLDPKTGTVVGNDISSQTNQVLLNLQAVIFAAGYKLDNVVKCTCFLKNMDDFAEFNIVYNKFFSKVLPARECVEVVRLPKDVLVEISAICAE